MGINKLSTLGLIAVGALLMTGCGQTNQKSHSQQSSSKTTSVTTSSKTSSSSTTNDQQSTELWNSTKDQELNSFMDKWAPTMGQSYTKYDGQNDLKTNPGMHYPSDLSQTTVNGSDSIGWAPSGKGSYDYNVVALYNYNDSSTATAHITYAFAFHNGQPVALVEQTTNGTVDWKETQNTDVQSNFAKIAAGKGSSVSFEANK